jgi:eukaryotic-like serine/threonine-protein kinase
VAETLGHYQLLERIGAGALGEVFRARDTRLGRTVAIKRVPAALASDASRRTGLLEAARAAAVISHPHVASLYEVGEDAGQLFLVVEHVEGDTLAKVIAGHPLHPKRAVEIAIQVADALAEVHASGVVHRDVRPDNIVITPRGQAKLLDTGLSTFTGGGALRAKAPTLAERTDGTAATTLRYLSPEQALGEPADGRSDIYSLGAVLHEMLTGKPAFEGAGAAETIVAVVQSTPLRPSALNDAVPSELDRIVGAALAKSLDGRCQSAAELAAALRAVAERIDAGTAVEPDGPTTQDDTADARTGRAFPIIGGLIVFALLVWWLLVR